MCLSMINVLFFFSQGQVCPTSHPAFPRPGSTMTLTRHHKANPKSNNNNLLTYSARVTLNILTHSLQEINNNKI